MGKILKQIRYTPAKIERGYSNKSLYINVGDLRIEEKEVTEFMKEKFVGGKALTCGTSGTQSRPKPAGTRRRTKS